MNVMNMGRHLVMFRPHSTSESSHQGEITYVLNMVKSSVIVQPLFSNGESTLERNPLNVTNVGKILVKLLIDACKPIPMRPTNMLNVVNASCCVHTLVTIGEVL